jgi:hypothetical protein
MIQALPLAFLILAGAIDAFSALMLMMRLGPTELIGKVDSIIGALLAILAMLTAAGLLIAKKYPNKLLGFCITAYSALMAAAFTFYAVSWFRS